MVLPFRSPAGRTLLASSSRLFASSASTSAQASSSAASASASSTAVASSSPLRTTSPIPWDPSQLPSDQRQQQLVDLRNAIFGGNEAAGRNGVRDGSKILKQRLQGPAMLRWYGERYTSWKAWNQKFPGLDLVDLQEQQRLADLEARRKRGKVTPKKGHGRRASMKKK
ncbi:hypothetical protein JCM10908_001250 [Rhodotorula pacifica]|uniref:mitochondrial 37S ribosomal protein mS33 RSM27 n=1 Tax=Rhodotorula pacifica TaxID=1495444 RepID=UPI003177F98D